MIYQKILEEYHLLQLQINEIQEKLQTMPEGKLICARGNNCFKWYKSDGHSRVYIPKQDRKLAEQLAAKKYLSLTLEQLALEKAALESYLCQHQEQADVAAELLLNHSGYQELLAPYFKPREQTFQEWMVFPVL